MNPFEDYLQFSVTTRYIVGADLNPIFPMVTVCSVNALNSAYFQQLYDAADVSRANLLFTGPYDILIELERLMKRTTGDFFTRSKTKFVLYLKIPGSVLFEYNTEKKLYVDEPIQQ